MINSSGCFGSDPVSPPTEGSLPVIASNRMTPREYQSLAAEGLPSRCSGAM